MSRVKDGNYITVQAFMVKDLHLKGNELLIYAIIYGFSQDDQSFTGSLQYLADWTNCSKQGVINNLKSLCDKGLLRKTEVETNGVKFCEYHANYFTGIQKSLIPSQKSLPGGSQKSLPGGSQKSLPNNIDYNNIDYNIEDSGADAPPTLQEIEAYCKSRKSSVNPQRFFDYYAAVGWVSGRTPIRDWKAKLRSWEALDSKSGKADKRELDPEEQEAIQRMLANG